MLDRLRASSAILSYCPGCVPLAHETVTHQHIARVTARLLGRPVMEVLTHDWLDGADEMHGIGLLYIPYDTLDAATAHRLGIHRPTDLFGGIVPRSFVATKVITHALVSSDAEAPDGWNAAMGQQLAGMVLPGFSAFSVADARRAGRLLLDTGPVRVKAPMSKGGLGQVVIDDLDELDAFLERCSTTLSESGVVLETNLTRVQTCSVGQIMLDGVYLSYVGTQRLTRDNLGREVYGGSTLNVARGDFTMLLQSSMVPAARYALQQACTYHRAAHEAYPELIATRCNYDVVQGEDASGRWCSGVLEQSWRVGGATGAELAAYAALLADSSRQTVRASTYEVYGGQIRPPKDAEIYFDGDDSSVGPLLKYARVENDAGS
jgi:hypothetical protein